MCASVEGGVCGWRVCVCVCGGVATSIGRRVPTRPTSGVACVARCTSPPHPTWIKHAVRIRHILRGAKVLRCRHHCRGHRCRCHCASRRPGDAVAAAGAALHSCALLAARQLPARQPLGCSRGCASRAGRTRPASNPGAQDTDRRHHRAPDALLLVPRTGVVPPSGSSRPQLRPSCP